MKELIYLNFDEMQNREHEILVHFFRHKQHSVTLDDVASLIEETRIRIAQEEE